MSSRDKIIIAVVVLISAAILLSDHDGIVSASGSGSSDGTFDRNFTVNGPVQLNVDNGSGSVTIRRGSSSKVEIHARLRANNWFSNADDQIRKVEQNPPVEQNGNTIRIYRPEPHDIFNKISITYDITVPEETTVNSSTGSGSTTVEGLKGPVSARSGSGSLDLSNIGAEVEAKTGSGSITLNHINGRAALETGSGSIRADGIAGGSRIRTGSGSITLRQTAPGDVDAETGSGHIQLEGLEGSARASAGSGGIRVDGRPKGDWEFHSGSGSIEARTANAGLDLYARTSSGSITVDPPITLESSLNNRKEIRGKVRGGGIHLEATTGSGSIHIE